MSGGGGCPGGAPARQVPGAQPAAAKLGRRLTPTAGIILTLWLAGPALAQQPPTVAPHQGGWNDCHFNQLHQQVCRVCRIQQGKVFCGQPRIVPPSAKPPPPPRG